MKKVVSVLVILLMMAGVLGGCANTSTPAESPASTGAAPAPAQTDNAAAPEVSNLEKSQAIDWKSATDNAGNPLFIDTYVPTYPDAPADVEAYGENEEMRYYHYEYPYANCVQKTQPVSPADGSIGKKIIILKNGDHPYHTAFNNAAVQASEIFGMSVEIMSANWDVTIQTQQVEQAINEQPDLIIYVPCDQDTSVTHLKKIYDAGIPVIGSNSMPSAEGFQYLLSFCGPDDWGQSKLLAEYLADKAGKTGGYAILSHEPGGSAYYARAYGVITRLTEYAPDMKLLDVQAPGTDSADQSKTIVADWITRFGNELNVIYTGETTVQSTGAIEASKNAGRTDIIIGGIDNSDTALSAVQDGSLTCATNQPPMQDGALPVLLAAKWFNGETLDQVVFMKPSVISAENVNDFLPAQW